MLTILILIVAKPQMKKWLGILFTLCAGTSVLLHTTNLTFLSGLLFFLCFVIGAVSLIDMTTKR